MKQLTIHTGPYKSVYFFSPEIEQRVRQGRHDFMAILPVNRAVRLYKKHLVDLSPGAILLDPFIFTFDDLLLTIYRKTPGSKRLVNRDLFLLITEDILTAHREDFPFIVGKSRINPGLVRKTTRMLMELRRFGYSAGRFQQKSSSSRKFTDFTLLLDLLEKRLGQQMIDEPFAMSLAAETIDENHFYSLFEGVNTIFISGYGLFTPAMFTFIERCSHWLDIHVKLEYTAENTLLFHHTAQAMERFLKMKPQIVKESKTTLLSGALFNRRNLNGPIKKIPHTSIEVHALKNREDEVAFMAATIRRLNLEQNIPLHRMAVTFANLENYVPTIRKTFGRFGIPMNLSTGYSLHQSPLIRTFMKVLLLIRERLPVKTVWSFLLSNFIELPVEFNAHLLFKFLIERRITHLNPALLDRLIQSPALLPTGSTPSSHNLKYQLELLEQILHPLFDYPTRLSAPDFRIRLVDLLNQLGLLHWYEKNTAEMSPAHKEHEFRAFNRFMKLLDKFVWMINSVHGNRPLPLSYMIDKLQNAIQQAVYNLTEWPDYGVQIMPRLEIQALDFKVLFIGGMIDGEFPRTSSKDIFFNDRIRAKLGLVAAEELLDQDRFIFYNLLDSQAETILLTFPLFEEDRALVPSTFISDLKEAAEIRLFLKPPASEELLNPEQLWTLLGLDIQKNLFKQAQKDMNAIRFFFGESEHPLQRFLSGLTRERERFISDGFSVYEGNLTFYRQIQKLINKKFGRRAWSISMLETYAFCPMQFFLSHILKLEELPEMEEEISPLDRGLVLHRILCRFYSELIRQKAEHRPADHLPLLQEIAAEELNKMPYSGFFWELEKSRYFGQNGQAGLLENFVILEQKFIDESDFTPAFLEYGFGLKQHGGYCGTSEPDPVTISTGDESFRLRGRIDRVDRHPDGRAMIFDYKSGESSTQSKAADIFNGLHFQLPLYLLALEKLKPGLHGVLGAYYLVKDSRKLKRIPVIGNPQAVPFKPGKKSSLLLNAEGEEVTFRELLNISAEQALEQIRRLQSGFFGHSAFPEDKRCQSYCPYRQMCQKNIAKQKKTAMKKD